MDGVLVVDKPTGPTSHGVVARVRRVLDERRVGHTGTLDPMARGVLPLVIGRATRLAQFLSGREKTCEADIRFGWATDTYEAQGTPIDVSSGSTLPDSSSFCISPEHLEQALEAFRGAGMQRPPPYSAKKRQGVAGYELA